MLKRVGRWWALLLLVTFVVGAVAGCASVADVSATMVLRNGEVLTMDETGSVVTAIAIQGDRIVFVGDESGIERFITDTTQVVDLQGQALLPGFVDSHIHAVSERYYKDYQAYLADKEPDADVYLDTIREFAANNPELPVVYGYGFQVNVFGDQGPHREMLDSVVKDRPVVILDSSHHAQWVNTKALEIAGVQRADQAVPGGQIFTDSHGRPTGYIVDSSQSLQKVDVLFGGVSQEDYLAAFDKFQEECFAIGITAIQNMQAGLLPLEEHQSALMGKTEPLLLKINDVFNADADDDPAEVIKTLQAGAEVYQTDDLQLKTVKLFLDGVPEGKTAYLSKPYASSAGMEPDYIGEPIWDREKLLQAVAAYDKAGLQVHMHAMGDAAVKQGIDAIEYAFEQNGQRDARHTITHVTLIAPEDIERMGQLGIVAALQPIWMYRDPVFSFLEIQMLGEERFEQTYPLKNMLASNVLVTGSSDNPVTPDFRPLAGIEVGVTRTSPYPDTQDDASSIRTKGQGVAVEDMLRAYTINGARQLFRENEIGSLEVGKKADFLILAQSPLQVAPRDIGEIAIVATYVNGTKVFGE